MLAVYVSGRYKQSRKQRAICCHPSQLPDVRLAIRVVNTAFDETWA